MFYAFIVKIIVRVGKMEDVIWIIIFFAVLSLDQNSKVALKSPCWDEWAVVCCKLFKWH